MHTIHMNSPADDAKRRQLLYQGHLFIFSPSPASLALCDFARSMLEEVFQGVDPRQAQFSMPVEEYVAIGAAVKPKFIHHPKTRELVRSLVAECGCELEQTYLDVPRLRMVTSDGYLTSGIGYAHHPHRDTWYSAPLTQLNWWLPIYPIETERSMAFHLGYWNKPVRNGSNEFNYYEWNSTARKDAAKFIHQDTRRQPKPEEPFESEPEIRVVCESGGIILFSAAHMHSTVPNTSGIGRYSIDFRTLNLADTIAEGGARNIDSKPHGTSMRDFVRGSDFAPFPGEVVERFEEGASHSGVLVFKPSTVSS